MYDVLVCSMCSTILRSDAQCVYLDLNQQGFSKMSTFWEMGTVTVVSDALKIFKAHERQQSRIEFCGCPMALRKSWLTIILQQVMCIASGFNVVQYPFHVFVDTGEHSGYIVFATDFRGLKWSDSNLHDPDCVESHQWSTAISLKGKNNLVSDGWTKSWLPWIDHSKLHQQPVWQPIAAQLVSPCNWNLKALGA